MTKSTRKFGKRLPDDLISRMHADYLETKSLWKSAEKFGRTAATLHKLFKSRGLEVAKRPHPLLDAATVAAMYADYQSGLSLAEVGKKWKRRRQAIFGLFESRGLELRHKEFQPVVEYNGRKYTSQKVCGRHRYLRDTIHRKTPYYLHHVVWVEHNGPIPRGHKVCFKDGNHLNCDIGNLELLSNSAQVRKHATGANQFTKTAGERLKVLIGGKSFAAELKRRAA